jgi:hypothetical protein
MDGSACFTDSTGRLIRVATGPTVSARTGATSLPQLSWSQFAHDIMGYHSEPGA